MNMPSNYTMMADAGGETDSKGYEKKCSNSTDAAKTYRRSSSEDPPSSERNKKEQVDDIVAAALAYAEQSYGDEGIRFTLTMKRMRWYECMPSVSRKAALPSLKIALAI